jgi:hypothetical protein
MGGRPGHGNRRCTNDGTAMPQPNGEQVPRRPDQNSTIIAVIEPNQSSWLVGGVLPGIESAVQEAGAKPERLLPCCIAGGMRQSGPAHYHADCGCLRSRPRRLPGWHAGSGARVEARDPAPPGNRQFDRSSSGESCRKSGDITEEQCLHSSLERLYRSSGFIEESYRMHQLTPFAQVEACELPIHPSKLRCSKPRQDCGMRSP